MSIFGENKKPVNRRQLRQAFMKSSHNIPGSSRMYTRRQREKMADDFFPRRKFGTHLSPLEVERELKKIYGERHRAKTSKDKRLLSDKLEYLKKFTGIKPY